jgi:hypothetical protein
LRNDIRHYVAAFFVILTDKCDSRWWIRNRFCEWKFQTFDLLGFFLRLGFHNHGRRSILV